MATLEERIKSGSTTVRDVLEQGGLTPKNVGWQRVVEAGFDLDAPASSLNDVDTDHKKLRKLGELGSESDFKSYLKGQNALNQLASNVNASPALNVFGAKEVARNLGIESAQQARRTAKFERVPEGKVSLKLISQAISEVPDPDVRAALAFNALVPLRPVEVAKLTVDDVDFDTGSFTYTDDRGNKVRAKLDLPEFALGILENQARIAKEQGRKNLFYDENVKGATPAKFRERMTGAVNAKGGLRDLLKPFAGQMGREIKGASDFRKLIPSIIVNELGYGKEASQIMGHTSLEAIAGEMQGITAKHYVSDIMTDEGTAAKKALRSLQNMYGEVLGLGTVNELAGVFRLSVPTLTEKGATKIKVVPAGSNVSVRATQDGVIDENVKADIEKQRSAANAEAAKREAEASRAATEAKIAEAEELSKPETQEKLVEAEKAKIRIEEATKQARAKAKAEIDAETSKTPTLDDEGKRAFQDLAEFFKGFGKMAIGGLGVTAVVGASEEAYAEEMERSGSTLRATGAGAAKGAYEVLEPLPFAFMRPQPVGEGSDVVPTDEEGRPQYKFLDELEAQEDKRQPTLDEQLGGLFEDENITITNPKGDK